MAQYFTDFSEYESDAPPGDWTARWVTSGATWEVVESAEAQFGSKLLRLTGDATARRGLTWDAIDADADRATVEILIRAFHDDASATGYTAARGSGATGAETLYNIRSHGNNEQIELSRYNNGGFSSPASAGLSFSPRSWKFIRVQHHGDAHRVRVWQGGLDDEPAVWDLEHTDSLITAAGWVGVFSFRQPTLWDFVGIGTGGDPAPSEAPTADPTPRPWLYRRPRMIGSGLL